ncbi:unnamed protein product [Mytilus coruscus]|uniref:C1q domain-containing protein n=1 Tax=Mytilus coruscus TaxID=42192 RepID=A0A6J8AXS2_MYTCO|nr:unnamed protein product [Mytilus coruscus]
MDCLMSLILIGTFVMYSEVEAGGSCLRLGGNNRPAFTATLNTHPLTLSGNNVIAKFDNVILNRGDGYDPKTGKFTAPKSGLYQFSFTIMSNGGSELHMVVVKNGNSIMKLYGSKIHGATETANPVLELKEGDCVYLTHGVSASQQMVGHHYSHMSGYYIGE